jgi:hypothetical protein
VPTLVRDLLRDCDGFRIESPAGFVGWVEESWLGPSDEPTALAVRTLDGRRGLLLADRVLAVVRESEVVDVPSGVQLLELDVPRMEPIQIDGAHSSPIAASWRTTGEPLSVPPPPGMLRRAMLMLRPWRLAPPARSGAERPIWELVGVLYAVLAVLVAFLVGLSFLVAHLAAGPAY